MSADQDNGWMLHSDGRRFGPLSEDELRGYFRAGMVKSTDRISAPGNPAMRPAAEVALALGETAPAGPPPAPEAAAPTNAAAQPVDAVARAADEAARQERAARAIAAMQVDLAVLNSAAPRRKGVGWMVPVVLVFTLIGALLLGLNMLKRMSAQAPRAIQEPLVGLSPAPSAARAVEPALGAPAEMQPREALLPASAPEVQAQLQAQGEMSRAEQLMRASDWAGLVSLSRQWSQAQPTRPEPWQFQGVAFSRLGDFNAAAEAFKQVLQRDPGNAGARVLLAEAYLQGGRHAEAAEQYKSIVAANPGDARMWSNYGLALSALDQDAQAIAALETAVKLDPASKPAWNNLGIAYQNAGDGTRAAAAFANAR